MIGIKQIGAGGGGSAIEQDNNDIVKTINTQTSSLSRLVDTITSSVNYTEPYDISETESLWFVFLFTNGVTMRYKLLKKGKGTYGNGGTPIAFSELLFISQSQTTVADLENLETTDIIFIEDLQGMTITQYVNQANPAYTIKAKSDGETIFKVGMIDKVTYWFVGDSGKYGLGILQSIDLDFQLLDNTESVADIPVSATQSGIVDNTSLQELGGVDKTINGVRIGRGSANRDSNLVFGNSALTENTTGTYNVAFGAQVLSKNTTGVNNLGIGATALAFLTTGQWNTAIGTSAMYASTTAQRNIAIGGGAMYFGTTASYNTAIGLAAMQGVDAAKFTGLYNTAVGYQAGAGLTSGIGNTILGCGATLAGVSSGSNNVIIAPALSGTNSGITTGSNNVLLGRNRTLPTDLSANVIISDGLGNQALRKQTNGATTVPSQTDALIDADLTGKSVLTKEYFVNRAIAKNHLQDNILLRAMNYTVNVITDFPRNNNLIIYGNAEGGDFTITLPSASEMKGFNVWVYNQGNNGSITVQGIILNAGKRTSFKSEGVNIYEW